MEEYKGFLVDEDFNIYNKRTGRKLTPFKGRDGYMQVVRSKEDGSSYHLRVHKIFAELFIPNPNNYGYINHIDSDKTNNSLDNLEWCSNSQNVYHGWHSGNRTHKNNTAVEVYTLDGEFVNEYPSIRKLAEDLHVDRHKVARILKGELNNTYNYIFKYK